MFTKVLKRKLVLEKGDDFLCNNPMELEYYLLESSIDYQGELHGEKIYGIGVVKRISDICSEENIVLNFSTSVNETNKLVDKLADNTVTPIGLQPVIDDLFIT